MRRASIGCAIAVCASLIQNATAVAGELRVVATPSVSAVLKELGPRFEHATGNILSVHYGLNAEQRQQIESGEFDLAIVPSFILDEGIKHGRVITGTRHDIARVGLGIGIRKGDRKPDVYSLEAFKRTMLDAKSVTYVTNEPSGKFIAAGFDRLGITDVMKAKTTSQDSVPGVWRAVASGGAEFGFGLASNAATAAGVDLAGLFPPELQSFIVVTAGVGTSARQAGDAKALTEYLTSPDSVSVFKASGLEPAAP